MGIIRNGCRKMIYPQKIKFGLVIPFLSVSVMASAQSLSSMMPIDVSSIGKDTIEVFFQKGVSLYNAEKYYDAMMVFQKIRAIPVQQNHFLTASELMLIKTQFRLGEIDQCVELGKEFKSSYPNSKYLDDVQYTIGEVLLSQEKYGEALSAFLDALKNTDDETLVRKAKQTIDPIIDLFITTDDLKNMRDEATDTFQMSFLTLKLADKYHAEGKTKTALQEMRSLNNLSGNAILVEQYRETEAYLKTRPSEQYYIGVILPLSGPSSGVGNMILNGIRYAVHQYRQTYGNKLSAIVLDNRGEMVQSIKHAEYLSKNPRVLAIIGPVSSENAIAVAIIANQNKIPMITPTATSSNLTSMGPYVFQTNIDFENMGRFLGKYSTSVSHVRNVATLSPADEFGKEITDAFCKSIDESGGKVLTQQWYNGEPADLKIQLTNIRRCGTELLKDQLSDKIHQMEEQLLHLTNTEGDWHTDITYINKYGNLYQFFTPDSIYYLTPKDALIYVGLMDPQDFNIPQLDSIQYTIRSIDVILLPSHVEDINLIVPQMTYYNIDSKFFGSGNWYNLDFFKNNRAFADHLNFISDYYIDMESKSYKVFVNQYSKLIGTAPSRFDLYGYDTMQALFSAMKNTDLCRENIKNNLIKMPTYYGLSRNISFKGNRPRVNSCAFILRFENNMIRPVAIVENGNITPVKKLN